MKYVHIRNLERYQPGYKDRDHIWAKIHYRMLIDPDTKFLSEVGFSRLVKLIVMETYLKKPLPLSERYLTSINFDFGLESLSSTLEELSQFIEIIDVTEEKISCVTEERRGEERRGEKKREICTLPKERSVGFKKPSIEEVKAHFGGKGFPAEADKFFDYYEANGWRVGRNPMKNWQSAVANWLRNAKSYGRLESPSGFNLNKTQQKNAEALSEFLKRQGTPRPEDLCSGNDAPIVVLPVSKSSA